MPNQSRRLPNRANDDVHVLAVVFSARNGRTIPATPAIPASLISSATLRIHTPDCGGSDSKSGELNPEECGCGIATSPKPSLPASVRATAYTPTHTQSAVRTRKQTEGNFELQVLSGSEWEAVDIAKARETEEKQAKAKSKKGSKALSNLQLNSEREEQRMSRNRPRGPPTRDNGAAANEEIEMWNRIRQDIFKAAEKNEKQKVPGLQLAALKEKITKANRSECTIYIYFPSPCPPPPPLLLQLLFLSCISGLC